MDGVLERPEIYHADERLSREQFIEIRDLAHQDNWWANPALALQVFIRTQWVLGRNTSNLPDFITKL